MQTDFLWWRDGVIYQIYPRSFADSNGDGIGDLNGITARLDYLADLGIDAVWLSPINPSPDVDFGYDVSDYNSIDPKYGTMADFDRLASEAHRRGIRIILDLVVNHTSDQHSWFQESRKSRDNPFRSWYIWRDVKPDGAAPNNWASNFGGSGWQFDPGTGQSYFHMFCPQQPDLNWRCPELAQAVLDIFRFWLDRGVDGFRLDVFNAYFKDERFHDNPPRIGLRSFDRQKHTYDINQPELVPLLAKIRSLLDSYPERYVVGETFAEVPEQLPSFLRGGYSSTSLAAYYCGPKLLHGTFNFEFINSPWQPAPYLREIQKWEGVLGPENWPIYVLNNHDNPRTATRFGQKEDDERMKVAAALLLTQRGTPFIYYGEEIGMRDITLERSQVKDPVGARYWPFYKGRDGCRAPMQWDSSNEAGFSQAEPWLPVHPDYTFRNVSRQQQDPGSLFHFYRRLIQLRREYPALREGMFLPLTFSPRTVLAYLRQSAGQTVLVAFNFSRRSRKLVLGGELARCSWRLLLSNKREKLERDRFSLLPLKGNEACILEQIQK
jgi:alpha-glucosidase